VELGRIARFETSDGVLDAYKHVQSERGIIGVLVELGGVDPTDAKAREVAHDLALHIASAAPRYVSRDDVPADDVERERAILEAQTREEGKPEQAIGKIVDGKLGGFFKSIVLGEQPFVRDPKTTIGALVATLGTDASVRRFSRVKIGEE
jgi:elongation factor Ts